MTRAPAATWAKGTYQSDGRATSWVKIKNPAYSQAEGRSDPFDGRARGRRAAAARLVLAQ